MLGKIKSAETKEEWESFVNELYDSERYKIDIEGFKYLPYGKEILRAVDAMLKVDSTTIIDDNNQIIDFQKEVDEEKYKDYKKERNTILKEYFENEDPIKQLNFKFYVLQTIWMGICLLLDFNPTSSSDVKDRKTYEKYVRNMEKAISTKERIKQEHIYSKYVSKRFYARYPHLKGDSSYPKLMTGLLFGIITLVKSKGTIKLRELEKFVSNPPKTNRGNPVQNRKGDRFKRYKNIILYIRCCTDRLYYLYGAQTMACKIEDVLPATFSKWKKSNDGLYWQIYHSFSDAQLNKAEKKIRKIYF